MTKWTRLSRLVAVVSVYIAADLRFSTDTFFSEGAMLYNYAHFRHCFGRSWYCSQDCVTLGYTPSAFQSASAIKSMVALNLLLTKALETMYYPAEPLPFIVAPVQKSVTQLKLNGLIESPPLPLIYADLHYSCNGCYGVQCRLQTQEAGEGGNNMQQKRVLQ